MELMLVGGITLVIFPLAWLLRASFGLDAAQYAAGFLTFNAAYVVNDPHFTVTYLLFYKDVRARLKNPRFVIAGFAVPVLLVSWAAFALVTRNAQLLGWMVQLMYLLVGWHYAKQGFGVLTVLSARRGVRIEGRTRAAVLFHAYAGWAFAWANPATPAGEFEEKGVVYWAPPHPRWFEIATGTVFAVSTLLLLVVLYRSRKQRLPWAPLFAFLVTVWAWTIFTTIDPVVVYFIPLLHSVQYLYFVWLMKRNEARAEEGPPRFGRPVAVRLGILALSAVGLAWLLFHGVPDFLDLAVTRRFPPSESLGATPFLAAFFVFVNLHHYFMDTVIWRRENPDTRWLRDP